MLEGKGLEIFKNIDWIGAFGSNEKADEVLWTEYSKTGTLDIMRFQKDYPELLSKEEAIEIAGGVVYDDNPIERDEDTNQVWWVRFVDGTLDQYVFTIDKETFYNLFQDYPQNLSAEEKEIFDTEYPYWRDFFKGRNKTSSKLHKVLFKKKNK